MNSTVFTAAIFGLALAASAAHATETATAVMKGPDGSDMGSVTLTQTPHGVLIHADVTGLTPGAHGFHIHETGACAPDFSAAGGHYAPGGEGHGLKHEDGFHAGDLPNLYAQDGGAAIADVFTDKVTLLAGDTTLFDADGSAIILHANPDSYGADPAAGARVACGVIVLN